MKLKHLTVLIVIVLVATLAVASSRVGKRPVARPMHDAARQVLEFYGPQAAATALYTGSETCLACHSGPSAVHGYDASGWRDTYHAFPFKTVEDDQHSMVPGKGIVADYNQNGIDDFKEGVDLADVPAFAKYGENAPKLGYSVELGYTMTIGEVTHRIFFAWGGNGKYKQRFTVRLPVTDRPGGLSAGTYVSPLQYNEITHEWVTYHPEHWWDDEGNPTITPGMTTAEIAAVGRSFDKKCSGCHFTGVDVFQDAMGEWVSTAAPVVTLDPADRNYIDMNGDGIREMTHIGCEACHGPGSVHVIGHGDPEQIISPEMDFDAQQANDSCGQCHVRGSSSDGTFGFLWNEIEDHPYVLGDALDPYFTPKPGLWPDGMTPKQHHQQWHSLYESSKPTFIYHQVTCYECHDLHIATDSNLRSIIEEEENGETVLIPTKNEDNTLCLACHATHGDFTDITPTMVRDYAENVEEIGKIVSAHTHHPYAPDRNMGLSRCTKCHMPATAKSAINYDIHSHTFEPIPPEKTLAYQDEGGMPNACGASCHSFFGGILPGHGKDGDIGTWNEDTDKVLAEFLMTYYGPGGFWWDHSLDDEHDEDGGE